MEVREIYEEDFFDFQDIMTEFYNYAGNNIPKDAEMKVLFDKGRDRETNFIFLGAFYNSKLVGIVSVTFGESSYKVSPFVWCDDLYVKENYRNKGIGKNLLQKVKEIAMEKGCSNILVGVGHEEKESQKFYKSLGFVDMNCKLMSLPII